MKKLIYLIIFIIILLFSYLFFFSHKATSPSNKTNQLNENTKDLIQDQINKMSLDEKIGQLIIAGINGFSLDPEIKNFIQKKYIGGVVFFDRNVSSAKQVLDLTNSIKNANKLNRIPLFISVDEEGGSVSRLPKELINLPKNSYIGNINSPKFSYNIGKAIGKEISSLGYNMDFAPVMDINSNPHNPVIGNRSFSNNKEIVSKLGIETMKGLQSENIIPVIKHFPGHGDTSIDSHIGLPIVTKNKVQLNNFELIPFKEAIDNGASVVMVSHILLSKIDSKYPASLSRKVINDMLRNQLNFKGVIITDDMTMGAITKNYNIGDASVQSLLAGSDIILVCHGYNNISKVLSAIKLAIKNNVISEQRIDQSLYRILSLKEKFKLNNDQIKTIDTNSINSYIKNILNK